MVNFSKFVKKDCCKINAAVSRKLLDHWIASTVIESSTNKLIELREEYNKRIQSKEFQAEGALGGDIPDQGVKRITLKDPADVASVALTKDASSGDADEGLHS